MKKIKINLSHALSIGIIILSLSAVSIAENYEKIPNGQPFQAILDLINQNLQKILANSENIQNLQDKTEGLQSEIDNLAIDLEEAKVRITANEETITSLVVEYDSLVANIENLISQVNILRQDVLTNAGEIDDMNFQIEQNMNMILSIDAQIRHELQTEKARIDALEDQVNANSEEVQNQIASLQSSITDLINQNTQNHNMTLSKVITNLNQIAYLQNFANLLSSRILDNTRMIYELRSDFNHHYHKYWDRDMAYLFGAVVNYSRFNETNTPTY